MGHVSSPFFCHGCDLFEDAVASGNKRANRSQKKYECTGGHSQAFRPTSLKPEYCPSMALDDVGVRSSHIVSEVADTAGTCAIGGDHMF